MDPRYFFKKEKGYGQVSPDYVTGLWHSSVLDIEYYKPGALLWPAPALILFKLFSQEQLFAVIYHHIKLFGDMGNVPW